MVFSKGDDENFKELFDLSSFCIMIYKEKKIDFYSRKLQSYWFYYNCFNTYQLGLVEVKCLSKWLIAGCKGNILQYRDKIINYFYLIEIKFIFIIQVFWDKLKSVYKVVKFC